MNFLEELQPYLIQNFDGIRTTDISAFLLNFFLCGVMCFVLGLMYNRYGNALSNRKVFARNFVVLGVTTMFVISIVKTSLALSLGLVGALSIVRFRAAIKEPEELTYLFLIIAIGLGMGADLTFITFVAFMAFVTIIFLNNRTKRNRTNQSLYLTVTSENTGMNLEEIIQILNKHAAGVKLKRTDELNGTFEASFLVEFESFEHMNNLRAELKNQESKTFGLTFMDNTRDF